MQEPFIDGHVQRTTRNLLLLSVGAIAVCLGLLGLSGRYLYNFFAGPFPTDTAALLAVSDPAQPLRRFVSVKGEGMMPTGLQQITVTKSKYTGAERSRRVSAAYGALLVDKRLLLVKTPGEPKGTEWTGELVATFGLVLTILGTLRHRPQAVPASVALYITAAYWFTSSTSFANPAITLARALTDTFAGIAPSDTPAFIACQLAGALAALGVAHLLFPEADLREDALRDV